MTFPEHTSVVTARHQGTRMTYQVARTAAHARGICLTAWLLIGSVVPVLAEPSFEGRYTGRGDGQIDLQVFALDQELAGPDYFVTANTTMLNRCTGNVRGIARRVDATTLRLTTKSEPGQDACKLTMKFNPRSNRVQLAAESCAEFHGTECDFTGSLAKR